MAKTKRIVILIEPDEYKRIVELSHKTGVPYAEVGRRLFARWLEAGELPQYDAKPKEEEQPKKKPRSK